MVSDIIHAALRLNQRRLLKLKVEGRKERHNNKGKTNIFTL